MFNIYDCLYAKIFLITGPIYWVKFFSINFQRAKLLYRNIKISEDYLRTYKNVFNHAVIIIKIHETCGAFLPPTKLYKSQKFLAQSGLTFTLSHTDLAPPPPPYPSIKMLGLTIDKCQHLYHSTSLPFFRFPSMVNLTHSIKERVSIQKNLIIVKARILYFKYLYRYLNYTQKFSPYKLLCIHNFFMIYATN